MVGLGNNINLGSVDAPYQEFTEIIPPYGVMTREYVTDNFVLLDVSDNGMLEINFGGAVNQTGFTAGLQYKLTQPVPRVRFFNKGSNALVIKYCVGVGDIKDNRLSVSGVVQVSEVYENYNYSRETIPASGYVTVTSAGKKTVLQNTGTANIYILGADGFMIEPGGAMDLPLSAAFNVYGTVGQTFVWGSFF